MKEWGPKMKILKTYFESLRKFWVCHPFNVFCRTYSFKNLNESPPPQKHPYIFKTPPSYTVTISCATVRCLNLCEKHWPNLNIKCEWGLVTPDGGNQNLFSRISYSHLASFAALFFSHSAINSMDLGGKVNACDSERQLLSAIGYFSLEIKFPMTSIKS